MKKMKFTLKNNGINVICEELTYIIENEFLVFNLNEWKIKIKYNDKEFYFLKEGIDDIISISKSNELLESIVVLKKDNISFDLKLEEFKYEFSDKYIRFEYKIIGVEETKISMLLVFENNS